MRTLLSVVVLMVLGACGGTDDERDDNQLDGIVDCAVAVARPGPDPLLCPADSSP